MAVQVDLWQPLIIANLYADNAFLDTATSADAYVLGGAVVHIPNASAPSPVVRNRTVLPATAIKRADTDIVYALDNFSTTPQLVHWNSTQELSYDFRGSIVQEEMANLAQTLGDSMLNRWTANLTAGQIVTTTGVAAPTTLTGATGNRKLFTKADLLSAKVLMDKQNVPQNDRVAVLTPEQLLQLLTDKDLAVNFAQYANIATGAVPMVYGFKIYVRSNVAVVDSTNLVSKFLYDAAGAAVNASATDNRAAICYQKASVERAKGEIKMFYRENDPLYYGDIYSFQVRLGGRVRRADNKGILAIVEAP